MSQTQVVEIGLLSFVPKGYILAKDGDKFQGNTRIFAIVNMGGKVLTKWANATSTQDGKVTFLYWFSKKYPHVNPPFRGKIAIFRKREALPT